MPFNLYVKRIQELEGEVKRLQAALVEAHSSKNNELEEENRRLREALAAATGSS